jgi:hypothetical protein
LNYSSSDREVGITVIIGLAAGLAMEGFHVGVILGRTRHLSGDGWFGVAMGFALMGILVFRLLRF